MKVTRAPCVVCQKIKPRSRYYAGKCQACRTKAKRERSREVEVDHSWHEHSMQYYRAGLTTSSEKYRKYLNELIVVYKEGGEGKAWELYVSQLSEHAKRILEYFKWTEFRYIVALAKEVLVDASEP